MARAPKAVKAEATRPDGPARVLLLTGAEAERKAAEAETLLKQADPDFFDFDSEIIDAGGATADRILGAVATYPLGSGAKVVLVRDCQHLDGDEQKRLVAGLGQIPPTGLLVLHTGTPMVEDGKVKRQSVVSAELANAVKKLGEVRDFALPKAEDMRGYLTAEARRWGKTLEPDALALLSQLPVDDVAHVGSELAKAALHAGDAPRISAADVEATISRGADDVIFKLCDAIGARRPKEALAHVATLFRGGHRPEAVAPRALVLLARQIRLIAQFRYLGERRMAGRGSGPLTPEVQALLPGDGAVAILNNPRMSWMADRYLAQARNFTGGELAARLDALLEADLMLKGVLPGGDNPKAVLQRLVVTLC